MGCWECNQEISMNHNYPTSPSSLQSNMLVFICNLKKSVRSSALLDGDFTFQVLEWLITPSGDPLT